MQFIEALKLKSKLLFLFILTTLALISVAVMGNMHINSMKNNIDSLYFGSLVPVTELNDIMQTYHNGLASTVYKASRLEISPSQVSSQIESSLKQISKKWKNYESHFKRNDELEYVEYAGHEIKAINEYFLRIYRVAKKGRDLSNISINTLEKKVFFIHNVIQKLINYEVDVAKYERKTFLHSYAESKFHIGVVLSVIIFIVLLISTYVFKSIQKDQTDLEISTKKLRKANKKLENVSYTDTLTNLHNRRYFNLVYDRELKRARRKNNYITFMMLDIDYFKQYNDTYGHIEGDFALKSVSKVLKEILKRPSDFVFRLGGEEFGVLLVDTDESNSAKLARDICDGIRERKLIHENSKVSDYVTISIGVVCCIADDALNDEVLISRADEMLYEAKESGRDRYIITSNASAARPRVVEEMTA
ncbi:diguanylate cyclase [Sulfurimonas aquatica]|uniref:diguanylate cyclase n=1 Tax=Sulfurimonas aquatica TaxID=2672570 RepID=A0A975AZ36_9BACT|nr:GGDEF domain-containing protein [Sulfurimonas aquatica]QSZ41173.1 diguanylate cyclase [Sulfurimonas aquatica]